MISTLVVILLTSVKMYETYRCKCCFTPQVTTRAAYLTRSGCNLLQPRRRHGQPLSKPCTETVRTLYRHCAEEGELLAHLQTRPRRYIQLPNYPRPHDRKPVYLNPGPCTSFSPLQLLTASHSHSPAGSRLVLSATVRAISSPSEYFHSPSHSIPQCGTVHSV